MDRRAGVIVVLTALLAGLAGFRAGIWFERPDPVHPWHALVGPLRTGADAEGLRAAALEVIDRSDDPTDLVEAVTLLGTVGQPGDEELLDALVRARDEDLAHPAIGALGRMATDEAVAKLVGRLMDRTPDAGWVIVALGRSRHPRAIEALLPFLSDARHAPTAAVALASTGDPAALDAVWRLVTEEPGPAAIAAARAIGQQAHRDPELADRVSEVLRGPRTHVRAAMLEGLASRGDLLARDALVADIGRGPGQIARSAVQALQHLRDPSVVPVLRATARRARPDVARAATQALAAQGTPQAAEALLSLAEGPDPTVAARALSAMNDWTVPGAVERVIEVAHRGTLEVRRTALNVLFRTPWDAVPPAVLDEARRAVDDPASAISGEAIGVLVAWGADADWATLEDLVDDGALTQRRQLVDALGVVPDRRARDLLLRLAVDANGYIRQAALRSLLDLGETEQVEQLALLQLARGTSSVEMLLADLGTRRANEALLERVRDGTRQESTAALYAIRSFGDPDQLDALLRIADGTDDTDLRNQIYQVVVSREGVDLAALADRCEGHDDPAMRAIAADALGRLGSPEARDRLIDMLGSPDDETRNHVLRSLSGLGGPEAEVALQDALHDDALRWTSISGLGQLGSTGAIGELRETAGDQDVPAGVRADVIRGVQWSDQVDGIEFLTSVLDDDDDQVRRSALFALSHVGTTAAAEALARALAGARDEVDRATIGRALSQMGGRIARDHQAEIDAAEDAMDGYPGR
jgi:HEAT repeat protein